MSLDTQNLRAFVEVAERQSFSLAAEHLHLTQPAVSKRVALLEQELESRLFDRIGRHVSLTEAGRALLPHAKTIARELNSAVRAVRDLSGEVSGELRLATSHHIGLHRLPPVISRFSKLYPQVQIDIEFMDSEQAYEQIMHGKAELAIVTLAPSPDKSLVTRAVWKDPLDVMVAREHALARPESCPIETLSTHDAILPGLNTYTGQIVKELFDRHRLSLKVSMATNYLETIRMMASVGLGWTVLPRSMCDQSLQALEVEGISIERTLGFIYHCGRSLSRAASAFAEQLQECADTEAQDSSSANAPGRFSPRHMPS